MPKYRAKANTFVDGRDIRAGQTFETDAKPSKAWELIAEPKAAEDEGGEGNESNEGGEGGAKRGRKKASE